jgi:hypothetical protein
MNMSDALADGLIGAKVKILTAADLGRAAGNQTHIGLLKDTFEGWDEPHAFDARVFYVGQAYPCRAFTDPIANPDGTVRSPKLRRGMDDELGDAESALLIVRSLAAPGDGLAVSRSRGRMDLLVIPSAQLGEGNSHSVTRRHVSGIAVSRGPAVSPAFVYRQDGSDAVGVAMEGESETVVAKRRKRNMELRDAYVAKHGYRCGACGMLMSEVYGEAAKDLIEVHHLRPLSQRIDGASPTRLEDLVGLCPNCHSVAHRRNPVFSPSEIRDFIANNGKWPKPRR